MTVTDPYLFNEKQQFPIGLYILPCLGPAIIIDSCTCLRTAQAGNATAVTAQTGTLYNTGMLHHSRIVLDKTDSWLCFHFRDNSGTYQDTLQEKALFDAVLSTSLDFYNCFLKLNEMVEV